MLLCLSLCFRVTNSSVVNVLTYSLFTCMWITAKTGLLRCFLYFFLFLTFVCCHAGIFSEFSQSLCTRLLRFNELTPFPAMWSSWSSCRVPSKRFLVDSSAWTMHAYFVLRVSEVRQVSLYFPPLILQSIVAGIGTPNFLRAFWIVSLNSHPLDQWSKYRAIFWHCQASVSR